MRVKIFILEITIDEYRRVISSMDSHLELIQAMGSSPRYEGEVVEHLTVPKGKYWLFPQDNDFKKLERIVKGTRIVKTVTVVTVD